MAWTMPAVLVVEDNALDAETIVRGLHHAETGASVFVLDDGDAAVDYVSGAGPYRDALRPDLILVDMSVPGTSGLELVEFVKEAPGLSSIPIIVFSASTCEADVRRVYDAHANAYVVKPFGAVDFARAISDIAEFFLASASLPDAATAS